MRHARLWTEPTFPSLWIATTAYDCCDDDAIGIYAVEELGSQVASNLPLNDWPTLRRCKNLEDSFLDCVNKALVLIALTKKLHRFRILLQSCWMKLVPH